MTFGRNSQPSAASAEGGGAHTQQQLEDAIHFARKHEQRVWGSGEHEAAAAEVARLEAQLEKLLAK